MEHFKDSVRLAPEPQAIAWRLIAEADEFSHVLEAQPQIAVIFSERAIFLHGGRCNAVIVEPRWQGPLAHVTEWLYAMLLAPVLDCEDPDYLIVVDRAVWSGLDPERQERLIFHELQHIGVQEDEYGAVRRSKVTGQPLLKLRPHDAEVFHAEILRYGPEVVGLEETCHAIVEGAARARRRHFKVA